MALLDIGLLALAQRQRWNALPILGAIGTALMQFAWVDAYFVPEKYFAGYKVLIFMVVFIGFQALFLAAAACRASCLKPSNNDQQILGVCRDVASRHCCLWPKKHAKGHEKFRVEDRRIPLHHFLSRLPFV